MSRFERISDTVTAEPVDERFERQINDDLACDCDNCECGDANECYENVCKCCSKECTGEPVVINEKGTTL